MKPETSSGPRLVSGLTGQIAGRFIGSLGLYTLVMILGILFGGIFYASFTWHGDELLYKIAHFCLDYFFLVIPLAWLGGAVVLFAFFWHRTLGYIEAVALASERLASPSPEPIHLPAPLFGVEAHLNLARENALRSAMLAKEAEQRKNDLVVYLAHDLKTPLTSVIGYLSLLRDEPDLPAEARARYTGVALDKAERLEELINEFFEITRFNLSRIELTLQRVDLVRMLEQITFEFGPLFRQKQLTCSLRLPARLEAVCDADKISRVFDNLLRNAAGYTPPGGEITVDGSADEAGVLLRFANPGPTIPPEKLARIFEQFYRLDASRASSTGGAGLGLAIARQIVEAHGGRITAASEQEAVRFIVWLPAPGKPAPAGQNAPEKPSTPAAPAAGPATGSPAAPAAGPAPGGPAAPAG